MEQAEGLKENHVMRCFCQHVSSVHSQQPESRQQETTEFNYLQKHFFFMESEWILQVTNFIVRGLVPLR